MVNVALAMSVPMSLSHAARRIGRFSHMGLVPEPDRSEGASEPRPAATASGARIRPISRSKRHASFSGKRPPVWLQYCMQSHEIDGQDPMALLYQAYQNHMDLTEPWR